MICPRAVAVASHQERLLSQRSLNTVWTFLTFLFLKCIKYGVFLCANQGENGKSGSPGRDGKPGKEV